MKQGTTSAFLGRYPVAQHYNLPNDSLKNLKCMLIATNFKSTAERKREKKLSDITSHLKGLNIVLVPVAQYTIAL